MNQPYSLATKHQMVHEYTFTLDELKLLNIIYPLAMQRVEDVNPEVGLYKNVPEDLAAFGHSLEEAITSYRASVPMKLGVAIWLNSVLVPLFEQGGTPPNIAPFTKEDARYMSLKLIEPYARVSPPYQN